MELFTGFAAVAPSCGTQRGHDLLEHSRGLAVDLAPTQAEDGPRRDHATQPLFDPTVAPEHVPDVYARAIDVDHHPLSGECEIGDGQQSPRFRVVDEVLF